MDAHEDFDRDDLQAITHLAIRAARCMFRRRITQHQLDSVRWRERQPQPSASVTAIVILIYIAGDRIASSHEYSLDGSRDLPQTPRALLSDLETDVIRLVQGRDITADQSDLDVAVPDEAVTFIEAAADALRTSRHEIQTDVAAVDSQPNEWQLRHADTMIEMADQLRREERSYRRERLFLVLLIAVPMTIAGAFIGRVAGQHPSPWDRVGHAAVLGLVSVVFALRLFDPREE